MKKLIGGATAIILGFFCFSAFFSAFLTFLAGTIPLILILVGCLTIYLKYETDTPDSDDTADNWNNTASIDKPKVVTPKLLGNTSTLVFHSPECKFSKSKKCTAIFDTREEAIQKNFKPCGICKP
jgi:fatty acid desaturase